MEKLNNIVEDAKASLAECAIKAAVTGYADGIKLGYDAAKTDELCDAFIGVWNDRATIKDNEWCDGFIEGWNANAHKVKVCHMVADEDACLWTCSVCGNDLYDVDRYCCKCGSKVVEYEPKKEKSVVTLSDPSYPWTWRDEIEYIQENVPDDAVMCIDCIHRYVDYGPHEQGAFCNIREDNVFDYGTCRYGEKSAVR